MAQWPTHTRNGLIKVGAQEQTAAGATYNWTAEISMHAVQEQVGAPTPASNQSHHAVGNASCEPCSSVNKQDTSPSPHPGAAAAASAIPTAQAQWGSPGTDVPLPMVATHSDHSDSDRRTATATTTQPDYCLTGASDLVAAVTTRAQAKKPETPEVHKGCSHSRLGGEAEPTVAPPPMGGGADMEPEPSLLPNEAKAAAMWRHTLALMYNGSLPSVVQQLAIEAIALTASAWGFASQDAVEAALMKVERRTPLTFACPQLGVLLRGITDTLAPKIWKQVKAKAEQSTGTSGYITEVQGRFGTLNQAITGWEQHFRTRTDRQCPLRSRTTEDILGGTSAEVDELMEVVDQTRTQGRNSVRSRIMDEAGDSLYGMLCYASLWREQCHAAVQRWKVQSRMAEEQQVTSTGTQTAEDHTAWEIQTTTMEEHLTSAAIKLDRVASMAESGADPDMTVAAVRQSMEMLATHLDLKAGAIM